MKQNPATQASGPLASTPEASAKIALRALSEPRYQRITCPQCGNAYQAIDFGCAVHYHSCPNVELGWRTLEFEQRMQAEQRAIRNALARGSDTATASQDGLPYAGQRFLPRLTPRAS